MSIHLYKYHCSGKEFLIYDTARYPVPLTGDAIRLICDRSFGSGADGLLTGPYFTGKGMEFCMYCPDGSENTRSEDGARIMARYLKDMAHAADRNFVPEHAAGETADDDVYFVGGLLLSDAYIRRNHIGCRMSA